MTLRTSGRGNAVYFEIRIWYNKEKGQIHVTSPDVDGFHTTVRMDTKSKRGHPNLFQKLAKALRVGCAPAPQEGLPDA